jgi:type I restriction enzyme S subunit
MVEIYQDWRFMMKNRVPEIRFKEFSGEWEEKRLGEIGELIQGLTYSPKNIINNGLLVLRSSNIQNNQLTLDDLVYVNINIEETKLTRKGDILICVRNGSKSLIGKNILISKNIPKATHGAFMLIFRSENKLIPHWFKTSMYYNQVNKNLGATINSINKNDLNKFILYIPSTPQEQQKIADTFSSLDNLIEAHNKKLELLKQHKKGLMQQLFPKDGTKVPEVRFKEFSGEWEEKRLGEICEIKRGASPRPINKYLTKNDGVSWIKIGDVKEGEKYITSTKEKITLDGAKKSREVKIGDFILSNSMSFGRPYILKINGYIHDGWLLLRIKDNKILSDKFLYELLSTSFIQNQFKALSAGSTVNNLKSDIVSKSKILIPPTLQEQQKIADTLSSLDNLIEAQSKKIEKLKEHKKGLMQKMFVS